MLHSLGLGSSLNDSDWRIQMVGGGQIILMEQGLRLLNPSNQADGYANAQIDDHGGRRRKDFLWLPPLRLTVKARFSHPGVQEHRGDSLTGTAGFGFWNDPFWMSELRVPTLPQAVWFFYTGAYSDLRLAENVPGCGWKAATIDARSPLFLTLLPTAPLALPLMRLPFFYRTLWPIGQRALRVSEALVPGKMDRWRIYTIDWQIDSLTFYVDGALLLKTRHVPTGPLGLVIWIDNQFMQLTPWGHFKAGTVRKESVEWLDIEWLTVEREGQSP